MKKIKSILIMLTICVGLFQGVLTAVFAADSISELVVERGSYTGSTCVYSSNNMISYVELISGNLPEGINFTFTSEGIYISGVLSYEGSYSLIFSVEEQTGEATIYNTHTLHITATAPKSRDLTVTKSPTSETVTEGEDCMFISAADNYSQLEWRVVSPDGTVYREREQIQSYFPGVSVQTYRGEDGREYMIMRSVPMALNGYYVQTKFWSLDGTQTMSTAERSCLVTVKEKNLPAPTITIQPEDAEAEIGKPITLEVGANSSKGTIRYQWYVTRNGTVNGGALIQGATGSKFVPPQTEGTCQYFCVVYAVNGENISDNSTSRLAAVKYIKQPEYTAVPSPRPTSQPVAAPTEAPGIITGTVPNEPVRSDHTVAYIVGAVLICAMLCGTALYINMSNKKHRRRK